MWPHAQMGVTKLFLDNLQEADLQSFYPSKIWHYAVVIMVYVHVDLLNLFSLQIFSKYGSVLRIVTFVKNCKCIWPLVGEAGMQRIHVFSCKLYVMKL